MAIQLPILEIIPTDLSDVEKFNYLRSLLSGAAIDAIAGLALSSAKLLTRVLAIAAMHPL